jgi:phosphoadenosine phosphosulfate reductase
MRIELLKKVDQSKKLIDKVFVNIPNLILANSGGKDSTVTYFLIKELGIDIPSFHNVTTIDPNGTIKFIKDNMPDTEIKRPSLSFYELIEKKGLPKRLNRFCCDILKERDGAGKNTIEGVRASESRSRKDRDYIQCDTRKSMKQAQHIYPIYDWTDEDVWEYIKEKDLPIAPCYKLGMKRLGCVGCPLISRKGAREQEFSLYPKRLPAIGKSIKKGMLSNPQWKLSRYCDFDENIAITWWLSGKTMKDFFGYELEKIKKNER